MKTLITGATGLLGGNTLRLMAREKRFELRALVRENGNRAAFEGVEAELAPGDIRDRASVDRAVKGCDYVVHCAASVSQWRPNLAMMRQVNVQGTRNVLTAALDAGVKRVVYVSTVDTLGLSSREHPADESCEHESMAAFGNPYIDTKYEAEQAALKIAAKGLDLVIVKPTYMIGEWDVKPTSGQMVIQVAKGRAPGYPGGGNNFVDVLDVAHGIILALDKGRSSESYILANQDGNLTYREMFTLIARVAGVRPPFFRIPCPLALAAGYGFDLAGRAFGFEPDVNSVTARMGYAPHYFTSKKAIRELGLPQSPLEPAVKRAMEWFRARGMV
ncbi:MAG TPA: NAD-dependent epimerase/dehydratase family protein [bacterium]|nr:NAD-dependent epimerase/dehydratase family protein [bacterium]